MRLAYELAFLADERSLIKMEKKALMKGFNKADYPKLLIRRGNESDNQRLSLV